MFITLTRMLLDNQTVECLINVDHVAWVQPQPGGAKLFMAEGPILETPESYPRVMEKLVKR